MFCTKCGFRIREGDAFCQSCGAPVRSPNSEASSGNTSGPVPKVEYWTAGNPTGSLSGKSSKRPREEFEARVRTAISDLGRSPGLIVAAVLFTLAILIRLFDTSNSFFASLESVFEAMDIPRSVYRDLISMEDDTAFMVNLTSQLPNILMAVGFWLLIGNSFSGNKNGGGNGGLVLMTVVEYINIGCLIIVCLFGMGALGSACSQLSEYSRYSSAVSEAQNVLGFAMLLLMGVVIFGLVLRIKTLGTIRTIRDTVNTLYPDSNVSGFVGVMNIIGGVSSVILLFGNFDFATLLLGISQIMMGIFLFSYKSVMSNLEGASYAYESGHKSLTSMYNSGSSMTETGTHNVAAYCNSDAHIPTWKRIEMMEAEKAKNFENEETDNAARGTCVFCGAELADDQRYCGACGYKRDG